MKTRIVSITLAIILLLTISASAYIIPKEYQNKPYMTNYDIYMVSKAHTGTFWADENIEDMTLVYTNSGRCTKCLDIKMEYEGNLLKKKIEAIHKLPPFPSIPKK